MPFGKLSLCVGLMFYVFVKDVVWRNQVALHNS